jgi:hypothetical protein
MTENNIRTRTATRTIVLFAVVGAAFFGAYQFAQARSAGAPVASVSAGAAGIVGATQAASDSEPACACCSSAPVENGVSGEVVEGEATVVGDVQTIDVDLSSGIYNPNAIVLKAGVPAEITFGESGGCTGQVMSKDLGFFEDLTTGAKTVKIPALDAGEYAFSCGMEMVFGKIVVR